MKLRTRQANSGAVARVCRTLVAALSWIAFAPLSLAVPRRADLVVFVGRDGGRFLDNCKYMFISMVRKDSTSLRSVYLANEASVVCGIRREGGRAVLLRSVQGIWALLRAGVLVVDSTDWAEGPAYPATRGAKRVQLWHGVPLKLVQLARMDTGRRLSPREHLRRWHARVTGRFVVFDWLASTSPFVTSAAFERSFKYKQVSHGGYPRNDAMFDPPCGLTYIGVDSEAVKLMKQHQSGDAQQKIVLFAPTFRESSEADFSSVIEQLRLHAEKANYLLLLKLHPWVPSSNLATCQNLRVLDSRSDVYPMLGCVDVLVTDYSSIYFDFLLLDKPVVFYCPDLEAYLDQERGMYFSYDAMTPGAKARTPAALMIELEAALSGDDSFTQARGDLAKRLFSNAGPGAAERLAGDMFGTMPAP